MLDPHRIGLNAESIGFQKRMLQDLDYAAIDTALQTDYNNQGSAVQVRRERDAAKNEIRVMGGQLSGFESNELLLTYARQQRQINGYPLRHFDSSNPAVILPKKYGGFPLYNRNQVEYPELVSVFTEPMSAPLQRDTELLGRAGAVAMSNDLNEPYSALPFVNPMTASMDLLEQNKNVFKQRDHLRRMSQMNQKLKGNVTSDAGVFVNKDGSPMTTADDSVTGTMAQINTFGLATTRHGIRAAQLLYREPIEGGVAGDLQMDGNTNAIGLLTYANLNPEERTVTLRSNESILRSVEDDNTTYLNSANEFTRVVPLNLSQNESLPDSGRGMSQQGQSFQDLIRGYPSDRSSVSSFLGAPPPPPSESSSGYGTPPPSYHTDASTLSGIRSSRSSSSSSSRRSSQKENKKGSAVKAKGSHNIRVRKENIQVHIPRPTKHGQYGFTQAQKHGLRNVTAKQRERRLKKRANEFEGLQGTFLHEL